MVIRAFAHIKDVLGEGIDTIRLSRAGKAIAVGSTTFLATASGSAIAGAFGTFLGTEVTRLIGGAADASRHAGRYAAFVAALASGITAGPTALMAIVRSDKLGSNIRSELAHSMRAGIGAMQNSGMTVFVALFIGGTVAALLPDKLSEALGAGTGAAIAAATGAVVTVGLGSMMNYLMRAAQARSRNNQTARRKRRMYYNSREKK